MYCTARYPTYNLHFPTYKQNGGKFANKKISFVLLWTPITHFLEKFLQERVFSKVISIYAPVPLNKRLTFANIPIVEKQGEELKARASDMERSALKAVIELVEVSQLLDLAQSMSAWQYLTQMGPTGRHRHWCHSSSWLAMVALTIVCVNDRTVFKAQRKTTSMIYTYWRCVPYR